MRQGRWLAGVALITLMTGCGPPSSGGDDDDVPAVDGSFNGCASATYDAVQVPAAMLVVLDRSSSMAMNSKWTFAAQAIVQALDADSFDGMHVGLYAAPSGSQAGPSCLLGLPVSCQAPPFPQVDLALAGADKSSAASGVRRRIKDWLTANSPDASLAPRRLRSASGIAGRPSARRGNTGTPPLGVGRVGSGRAPIMRTAPSMRRVCSGVVPQQPPTMRTPACITRRAQTPKCSGLAT